MAEISGHCMCGAVIWRHEGKTTRNLNCHCNECRRGVSGAFSAVLGLRTEGFEIEGPWADYKYSPESSRAFCPVCGTRIWFRSDLWPDEVFVNVGALDEPSDLLPDQHVLYAERVPWVHLEDDIPKSEGFQQDTDTNQPDRAPIAIPDAALSGRCLCGEVTWQTDADPLWTGHCHCDSCRRATGAPFASFLCVPADSVTWTGEQTEFVSSQGRVTRRFCNTCGTHTSYETTDRPNDIDLYAASLNDPARFKPNYHFHNDERLPWLRLDEHLPKPRPRHV